MLNPVHSAKSIWDRSCRSETFALLLVFAIALLISHSAQGQTFSVLHSFTGGSDGAAPYAGVTLDRGGNLYGTASSGGASDCGGCGVVYKLRQVHSAWLFTPIYTFQGPANQDGEEPFARVVFGPDGALYGTTWIGGSEESCMSCGIVYRLTPSATACKNTLCPWTETILHIFNGGDGAGPGYGDVTFDGSGNLFGTTISGGGWMNGCLEAGCGAAYEISPVRGGWTTSMIYDFANGSTNTPWSAVIIDSSGNLYGTTNSGGDARSGSIYELSPGDGGSWSQTVLYNFLGGNDGGFPTAGLVADGAGNYYGATLGRGANGGGTIFELSPIGAGWAYSVIYSFTGHEGPLTSLTLDAAGNLYGTTHSDGANRLGNVFQLTRTNGSWTYTSLHDFTGGSDGAYPVSNVVLDSNGNLYGTASGGGIAGSCGGNGCGVVWEITR